MTWEFKERLGSSMLSEDDRRVEEILRGYFAAPPDFAIDWSHRRKDGFARSACAAVSGLVAP